MLLCENTINLNSYLLTWNADSGQTIQLHKEKTGRSGYQLGLWGPLGQMSRTAREGLDTDN